MMSTFGEELTSRALELSSTDRKEMVKALIQSLDGNHEDLSHDDWISELRRRSDEIFNDPGSSMPAFEALDEIRREFS